MKENLIHSVIYFAYYHLPIKKNWVSIESKSGEDLAGNMLRITQEVAKMDYGRPQLLLLTGLFLLSRQSLWLFLLFREPPQTLEAVFTSVSVENKHGRL